jgi:hypothetical protein
MVSLNWGSLIVHICLNVNGGEIYDYTQLGKLSTPGYNLIQNMSVDRIP